MANYEESGIRNQELGRLVQRCYFNFVRGIFDG